LQQAILQKNKFCSKCFETNTKPCECAMADLDEQEKQKMIENARRLEEDSTNNFTDQMAISEDFGEVEDDQKE